MHRTPPAAMLEVNDLHLAIDDKMLLHGVAVSVTAGELLAVIGPNGAGKTSLLKAIAGELTPTHGSVIVNGRELADIPLTERARCIAVLPQLNLLNFPFTVEEVILLGRTPHATGRGRDQAIVIETMTSLDILSLRDRLYTQLSGGERQRVQLARVMAQVWDDNRETSRLLLLDEPISALDLGHQQMLMATLRALADQGMAVIMTVHDVNVASAHANRILALKDGRGVALGCPENVVTTPIMQNLYGVNLRILTHPSSGKPLAITA